MVKLINLCGFFNSIHTYIHEHVIIFRFILAILMDQHLSKLVR
jgi:hypothetical protein